MLWLLIACTAAILGRIAATKPTLLLMLLAAGAALVFVLSRNGVALVAGTLATLAWGRSQLPLQSLAYPAKFAMFAVVSATIVHALVSNTQDRLPIPAGF